MTHRTRDARAGQLAAILAAALVAAAPTGARARLDESGNPYLLSFTDDAARAAGIGPLRETPLPVGEAEIRIWTGFGIVSPDAVLRLRTDATGRIDGELLLHDDHDAEGEMNAAWFRSITDGRCARYLRNDTAQTCVARFGREPDWRRVLERLDAAQVRALPDESALPLPKSRVHDGMCIVVELREGERYRAYSYCNPGFRDEPEAANAVTIASIVGEVESRAMAPTRRPSH